MAIEFVREKKLKHNGVEAKPGCIFYIVRTIHKMKWAVLSLEYLSIATAEIDVTNEMEKALFELMEEELKEKLNKK